MNESLVGIIIASLASPAVLYLLQQWNRRRNNKVEYGDDLLDVTNKMAASLKEARQDLSALEIEMRKTDREHTEEVDQLDKQWQAKQDEAKRSWDERQARLKARVLELEKIIIRYDISFTLTTHPQVQSQI